MSATFGSNVGTNLRQLIKEKFGTQKNFAKAHFTKDRKTSARQVRRWINEGVDNIDTVAEIAKTLDVSLKALLA